MTYDQLAASDVLKQTMNNLTERNFHAELMSTKEAALTRI